MKLKYITLASFIIFVGAIVSLAFLPVGTINNPINNTNDIKVVADPSLPVVTLDLQEVAKHNTKQDCYLIIKGGVYSVSSFIDAHPGGVRKIVDECGGEASAVFSAIHSNFAWNLLKDYYIGDLGQSVNSESINTKNSDNTTTQKSNTNTSKYSDDDEEEYEKD
ncbi:MAG: cytochrome b5 domain-containing protein [Candidatus Paceibacterota bacterium]